jgi:hypothetical protein
MYKLADKASEFIVNKDAHNMYINDFTGFVKECKKYTQKSFDDRFKNQANSILKFSEYLPLHDKILD